MYQAENILVDGISDEDFCVAVAVDFVRELGFHFSFTSILSQLQAVAGNVDNGNTIDSEITIIQNLIHITSTATSTVVRGVPII